MTGRLNAFLISYIHFDIFQIAYKITIYSTLKRCTRHVKLLHKLHMMFKQGCSNFIKISVSAFKPFIQFCYIENGRCIYAIFFASCSGFGW
jgi:hypothetical protein